MVFLAFLANSITILVMIFVFSEHTTLYRQGQIDALSGKILFELKEKSDGTSEWVRK
jgi:hypothetical protein